MNNFNPLDSKIGTEAYFETISFWPLGIWTCKKWSNLFIFPYLKNPSLIGVATGPWRFFWASGSLSVDCIAVNPEKTVKYNENYITALFQEKEKAYVTWWFYVLRKWQKNVFDFFLQSLDRQGDLKSLSLGEINHGFSWEQVKLPYHNSLKLKCSVAYITCRGSQANKYCGPDL